MRLGWVCLLLVTLVDTAHGALLWDNFLTPPAGYDAISYRSSERNAEVRDSWTADDALFDAPVIVQAIEWMGLRRPGFQYAAEAIILDDDFEVVASVPATAYAADPLGSQFGYEVFRGRVELSADVPLAPGRYYFAARLVTPGDVAGRHFVLTTGGGESRGTVGAFQSSFFDYQGAPAWRLITDAYPGTRATDYAYRIHGIPEPAAASALLALLLCGRTRRFAWRRARARWAAAVNS